MRRLPKNYRGLHAGLTRIGALNQRLHREWAAEVSRWNQAADREYAERWAAAEQARAAWENVHNQVQPRRVIGWALLLIAVTLVCPGACAFSVSGGLSSESTFYDYIYAIGILLGSVAGVVGLQQISRAGAAVRQVADQLMQDPTIDFDPKRPRSLPNPLPPQRRHVPAIPDLTGLWWQHLEAVAAQDKVPSKYGDIGELDLMDELKASLPDSYFAIRGLKMAESLDIDVLLFGPTGVWNLESKFLSGEVTFENGHWRRQKDWVENGIHHHKDEILKDLHAQWLWERDLLEKRLKNVLPGWNGKIQGGLVFTLSNVNLNIGRGIPVSAGKTAGWIKKIHSTPVDPMMTEEILLTAADALLNVSQSFQSQPFQDAARLAEEIYNQQAAVLHTHAQSER